MFSFLKSLFRKSHQITIKPGTKLYIGIPAKKPQKLLEELIKYARNEKAIKSIYIAQMYDETNGARATIGIEFAQNVEDKNIYFENMFKLTSKTLDKDQFVDFVELSEKDQTTELIKKHGERIY